jgi:predicted DNA-binding transcriptional regulator YafY
MTVLVKRTSMKFIEYAQKLEALKYLVEHKRAGTARQLSKKLQVSERTIQRMLQHLREFGCPIKFNCHRHTYEVKNSQKKY